MGRPRHPADPRSRRRWSSCPSRTTPVSTTARASGGRRDGRRRRPRSGPVRRAAGQQGRREVRRCPLLVGLAVAAVIARRVRIRVEQVRAAAPSRASWRSSTAAHAAGAGRTPISATRCSRQTGAAATASAQAGSAVSFTTLSARPASVCAERSHAGQAGGRAASVIRRVRLQPARGVDRLELAEARNERGAEEDRRTEAPRSPPVRIEDGRGVAAAEPARRVERLAERDVVDALREDRLEPRRPRRAPAPGTAGSRAPRRRRRGGRPRSCGPAGGSCRPSSPTRRPAACPDRWGDDGTGWVRDLLVMFRERARWPDARPRAPPRHRRPRPSRVLGIVAGPSRSLPPRRRPRS